MSSSWNPFAPHSLQLLLLVVVEMKVDGHTAICIMAVLHVDKNF
jgi:hypothetical protein